MATTRLKPSSKITGLILAGGLARRMNGQDKGLILYQGRPLIEHLLSAFAPQVQSLIISANRNQIRYLQYSNQVYQDEYGDFSGPLAGIATALKHCQTDWLVCTPCDAISLPSDFVQRLYQQVKQEQTLITIAHDGTRLQPLYTLLHRSLLPNLEDYLNNNNQQVTQWMMQQNPTVTDFSKNAKDFRNINYLDDLFSRVKRNTTLIATISH